MADLEARGVLDTCAYIDFAELDADLLPDIPELTVISMTELHQSVAMAKTAATRAARLERLNAAVQEFEPIPYDDQAASRYGTLATLIVELGRSPKPRRFDLMIASIASVHQLPLFTRNPSDFLGLEPHLRIVAL